MCGIAGILHFNSEAVSLDKLKSMTDSIAHRGPDGERQWRSEKGNVGLGHRRLSIIDLTDSGAQPMQYAKGRFTITFNGEIYNYIELKQALLEAGYSFESETDTEVLLALYDQKGKQCLADLDGMFAFAIWDEEKQELFCARDRFGEKPFFYFKDENHFIFASELKALWKAGVQKNISSQKIYEYLLYGTIQDYNKPDQTFYQEVYSIEPAHSILINSSAAIQKECYWQIDLSIKNTSIGIEEASQHFYQLLLNSVDKRLRSDVPVGSSLSGGLDSSSIVALIAELKSEGQQQSTFSARFKNFSKDEGYFIQQMLDRYPSIQSHEVYPSESSVLNHLEKIIYHQDEPFNSMSISAQFEVMQLAKKNGVTVLLDGQGADEYLAGYDGFYSTYYSELQQLNRKQYNEEIKAYKELKGSEFKQASLKDKLKLKSQGVYQKVAHLRRKTKPANDQYFMGIHPDIVNQYKGVKSPIDQPNNLKQHLLSLSTKKGLSQLLRYADRNSMANSIEVRLPFLDHQLVEFVFGLPDEFLIQKAWTKFVLRKGMEGKLPKEISWRKDKIGYEPPQNKWMTSAHFQERVKDSRSKLLDNKLITKTYDRLDWHYLMLASYVD